MERTKGAPRSASRGASARARCAWAPADDPLYLAYHDEEWGVPHHGERDLLELLVLEGFQAGLSWRTILHKREAFRRVFQGFDADRLARWKDADVARAVADPGIVRHRSKVEAAVANARAAVRLREAGGLDAFAWRFVSGEPIVNRWARPSEVPARTAESEALSRALRARGFAFVGPTTCYAFMQAAGLVDDHLASCFRATRRRRPRRA